MKHPLLSLAVFSACFLTLFSCNKEDSLEATDTSPIIAAASIDLANELDFQTGSQISFDRQTEKTSSTSCAGITMDPVSSSFPKTFYVDFGSGCTINNINRKGKLKISFSAYLSESGSTMTIERINYSINGNKVEGKITYVNSTVNLPQWTRTVTDGLYTNSKGAVYQYTGTHTIRQTTGVESLSLSDNIFEMIAGNYKITNQSGGNINLKITEPIIKSASCDYVTKGKIKVESSILNGTIDYGTGDCDNKASYTQNGIVFPLLW